MTPKLLRNILLVLLILGIGYYFLHTPSLPSPQKRFEEDFRRLLDTNPSPTFVFLGDSITAGTNSHISYVDEVRNRIQSSRPGLDIRTRNAGLPGDTASNALRRLDRDVLFHRPDVVFIEFGWNDLRNGVPPESFREDLASIVKTLRGETGAMIVLLTTTHVNVALANWKVGDHNEAIREIAEEFDCALIDVYRFFENARGNGSSLDELMSADNIHPSPEGHRLIATAIQHTLGL